MTKIKQEHVYVSLVIILNFYFRKTQNTCTKVTNIVPLKFNLSYFLNKVLI